MGLESKDKLNSKLLEGKQEKNIKAGITEIK